MAEVLFGQSYYLRFDPKLWQAMQPYPPLGTLYAASYLRERGYEVALFDAMLADSESGGRRRSTAINRAMQCSTRTISTISARCACCECARPPSLWPDGHAARLTVIACGADATDHADGLFQRGVHYVLIGEGENTLGELLDSWPAAARSP